MSQFKNKEKRIFTTHKHFIFKQQISRKPQCLMKVRILHDVTAPQPQNTLRARKSERNPPKAETKNYV